MYARLARSFSDMHDCGRTGGLLPAAVGVLGDERWDSSEDDESDSVVEQVEAVWSSSLPLHECVDVLRLLLLFFLSMLEDDGLESSRDAVRVGADGVESAFFVALATLDLRRIFGDVLFVIFAAQ